MNILLQCHYYDTLKKYKANLNVNNNINEIHF